VNHIVFAVTQSRFEVTVAVLQSPPVTLTFGMCQRAEGEGECCVQKSYESIHESECMPKLREWQWARPENGCLVERQRNGFSLSQHFVPNGEGGEG